MADADATRELGLQLAAVVGAPNVISDPDRLVAYEHDWTRRWHGQPLMAVRPVSTEQTAAVLALCSREGAGVVVHGGNTGLSGGATPFDGEIVLDTTRLDQIEQIDTHSRQVTVGAGVTLETVQSFAQAAGLDVAVDLAARSRATIGGMVATDAGGALALRYGTMRTVVAGLEAVLADGQIVSRLSGLLKDNAGYDLPALLIGSEGTLAALTKIRLTLVRRPQHRVAALIGSRDYTEATNLVAELQSKLGAALEAAECLDEQGMRFVCEKLRASNPLSAPYPVYLLIQIADDADPLALLGEAVNDHAAEAMVVAEDRERQRALWAYREMLNEAVGAHGVTHKYDVSILRAAIPEFVVAATNEIAASNTQAQMVIYGHLGDGNLHLNVLGVPAENTTVDHSLAALVAAYDGSISAEHGIGRAKRAILHPTRSLSEIDAMRAIKHALDPADTLGRNRVLPSRPTSP